MQYKVNEKGWVYQGGLLLKNVRIASRGEGYYAIYEFVKGEWLLMGSYNDHDMIAFHLDNLITKYLFAEKK